MRRWRWSDLERHTPDKSDEMDGQRLHPFGSIGRLVDVLPLPLVENFPQRVRNSCIVLLARDFFLGRAIELDEVIVGDSTFFRVKFASDSASGTAALKTTIVLRQ
jgi:hypothetical protein